MFTASCLASLFGRFSNELSTSCAELQSFQRSIVLFYDVKYLTSVLKLLEEMK